MKERHRKLLGRAAMVAAGLFVLYLIADFAVFRPIGELNEDTVRLEQELQVLEHKNHRESRYLASLRRLAARTYGSDRAVVSEQIRVRLDQMTQTSGLRRDGTAIAMTGRSEPNVYSETGWKYNLVGTMEQAVNLLYLLREDPYLHRLEGLSIVPQSDGQTVDLSFRYMTIVLDEDLLEMKRKVGGETKTIIVRTPDEPLPLPTLGEDDHREDYALITGRNIFRPYIQKPPPPPRPQPRFTRNDNPPPPRPSGPDWNKFKVVSLSHWRDEPDIAVKNTATGEIQQHKIGDKLAGGTITMVDYRQLPQPNDPELLSPSRVIVRVGEEFFAVELGQTLAQKHRLAAGQLPAELNTD